MCGVSGFSLLPDGRIDRSWLARVLLASVAERGDDASGMAWRDGENVLVRKSTGGASHLLRQIEFDISVREVLLHVRDVTKGTPSVIANNHPIRHGAVSGVHNGRISNDESVFAQLGRPRAHPEATVDSEAIFASLDHSSGDPIAALERLRGSLACAWFDDRHPREVFLARGFGRPLWLGQIDGEGIAWASTLEALELASSILEVPVRPRPIRPGTLVRIQAGRVTEIERFRADVQATWLVDPAASPAERHAAIAAVLA